MNYRPTRCFLALIICALPVLAAAQDDGVEREYLTLDWTEGRAFSPVVTTTGGKTIWLAGVTVIADAEGNSLAGDFEGQTREIFRIIEDRLEQFGGTLSDIVTMTVYISDTRFGDPFVAIRRELFEPGGYPSSALITVTGFARPESLLEVKATAVVGAD